MPKLRFQQRSKLEAKIIISGPRNMVWVSNHCAWNINVSITNKSGGDANQFTVIPEKKQIESPERNHWSRSWSETLILSREGGKSQTLTVGPSDFVRVYADVVIVSQANVLWA